MILLSNIINRIISSEKMTKCGSICSKYSSCSKSKELEIKDFYVPQFLTPKDDLLNYSKG